MTDHRDASEAGRSFDPVALHDAALDATGRIVAQIRPHQLSLATPCAEWDVRQLLEHLIEGNEMFTRAVTGGTPGQLADDLLEGYMRSAEGVSQAWHEPGVLDRDVTLPFGTTPGRAAVLMHFVDTLVHGWDLAKATGQDSVIDENLATAAYAEVTGAVDDSSRGPGLPFSDEVRWSTAAPIHERLVAFLGRRP